MPRLCPLRLPSLRQSLQRPGQRPMVVNSTRRVCHQHSASLRRSECSMARLHHSVCSSGSSDRGSTRTVGELTRARLQLWIVSARECVSRYDIVAKRSKGQSKKICATHFVSDEEWRSVDCLLGAQPVETSQQMNFTKSNCIVKIDTQRITHSLSSHLTSTCVLVS